LSEIAFLHGTTVEAMMEANPEIENSNLIVTGQVLEIADPVPVTAPPFVLEPGQYLVQRGDTLSEIAFLHGTTVEAMMEANPQIEHPSLIVTGQVLTIADPVPVDDNEEGDG
jgi:peptidoglycan DL-endopeptidase LytE